MSKPKINHESAIKSLEHSDPYKYLLWMVQTERDRFFREVGKSHDAFAAGKWAGRIDATDWILELLTPQSWLEAPYDEG